MMILKTISKDWYLLQIKGQRAAFFGSNKSELEFRAKNWLKSKGVQ